MKNEFGLKGKVAIITGASAGMGRAIALKYASTGASVIANARRKEKLDELVKDAAKLSGEIVPFVGDASDDQIITKMTQFAIDKFGKLDVLVCNAGIMDNFAPAEDVPDKMWNDVMNVNLTAPFKQMRAAIPMMAKNENGGSIVVISSVGGLRGGPAGATYVASKHGVIGLVKAVAYADIDKKIRCNAIAPGAVATDIGKSMDALYPEGMHKSGAARSAQGNNLIPRYGTPEEIANVALFLASDASSIVNGIVLTADAGWSTY
jgi:NAD(P)-dependent dehydrogenase (short-subunit alcohol dehydrogenase family)